MNLLVDTSVWSLALRRNQEVAVPEVDFLRKALTDGETICMAAIILQELLQGFSGAKDQAQIIERFQALRWLVPSVETHVAAAQLRNTCRRAGVQLGTIDALLAQLCIEHDLLLLTTDRDFSYAAKHVPLRLAAV
ncbi:type II toxin-antitoxin system VapC family toxin [Vandammella animalimorsus]|uniref:Ribonuclease VapC n=1 Tax=Vandammella animalimorsus TaxID=2029117 RepID=A0A2A2ABW2_9BURK|nr:PIN domain-containing protein [Vandammella animalimorsus]PAT35228.1 VapC toxin family PIN domain ribonuclease [Vandammella animalimorsus]